LDWFGGATTPALELILVIDISDGASSGRTALHQSLLIEAGKAMQEKLAEV